MQKFSLVIFICLLFSACQKGEGIKDYCEVSFQIDYPETKVEFNGASLAFTTGDNLALNVEGVNTAVLSNNGTGNVCFFNGRLTKKNVKINDADWYVAYPSSAEISSVGIITANLPAIQKAPFDKSALTMYSDIVTGDYDEDNIPVHSFSLRQALGIIKISIVNTEEMYSTDCIEYIQLSSSSTLSGTFTLDIHEDSPQPVFSQYSFKNIISRYENVVSLSEGETHTVFLFVNPSELHNCVLKVVTNNHIFTKEATASFNVDQGGITAFNPLTLDSFNVAERSSITEKKLACWGSSVVNAGYSSFPRNLQDMLGDSWIVYNGGVSGDRIDEMAARQGGVSIVTNSAFTLPAKGSITVDGGILRTRNNACESGYFHMRHYYGALANPCSIMGIQCNVTSTSTYPEGSDIDDPSATFSVTYKRIDSGEPVYVPEHTPILSYGALNTKDADLQILFGGGNGVYVKYGDIDDPHHYDNLINYHKYMTDFNTNQSDYLILCYWMDYVWNLYYYNSFLNAFDHTRVVDLRRIIPNRGRELMVRTGAYPDEASIPQSELDRVDAGDWPYCFWHTTTDSHPSEYGARAVAIVIYERMQELGYLD